MPHIQVTFSHMRGFCSLLQPQERRIETMELRFFETS